jgi:hypothetical protein
LWCRGAIRVAHRSIPSAQKAATAVLDMKPCVQRRLCTGGDRCFPARSPIGIHNHVLTPLRSKSSRVDKVTIAGGGRILRSALDSHILSHVRSISRVGTPVAVAFFSSLDDDEAASLSFVRRCVFRLGDDVFLLMPNRMFFISESSARMLPMSAVMSCRICIIWSPNLDRKFVTVLI